MTIAIQNIVSAKRDDMSAGQHVMRAALHDSPYIKVVCVQKRGDCDPQELLASKFLFDRFGKEILGNPSRRS